jgi:hypothetical protein
LVWGHARHDLASLFHEIVGNDAAWALLGVTAADAEAIEEGANWERGHFYELGLRAVFPKMGFLFEPTATDVACEISSP